MLKICILTENRKLEKGLRSIIDSYIYEKMISVDVEVYRDLKLLLKCDMSGAILFIDDSDEKSAIRFAQILREHDHTEEIVIITDNIEHVYEAFKVSAYRVLQMPIAKVDIYETLDSFSKKKLTKEVIIVKNGPKNLILPISEIIYVASLNRDTRIVTRTGIIPSTVALYQISAQLPEEYFFACHRAYVVNMMNIRTAAKGFNDLKMSNGETIPISRRRKADFIAAWEAYLLKSHPQR